MPDCAYQPLRYPQSVEYVPKSAPIQPDKSADPQRPLVFLDTGVITAYLRGERSAVQIFAAEATGQIRFAINPIVLQELLLAADSAAQPEFEQIRDHLDVLPVDYAKAKALLPRVRALRNRLAHSNEILILSSASECDFLVTGDAVLKTLGTAQKPQVVTPEELVTYLRAA